MANQKSRLSQKRFEKAVREGIGELWEKKVGDVTFSEIFERFSGMNTAFEEAGCKIQKSAIKYIKIALGVNKDSMKSTFVSRRKRLKRYSTKFQGIYYWEIFDRDLLVSSCLGGEEMAVETQDSQLGKDGQLSVAI